jgi:hypothetical protein
LADTYTSVAKLTSQVNNRREQLVDTESLSFLCNDLSHLLNELRWIRQYLELVAKELRLHTSLFQEHPYAIGELNMVALPTKNP